MEKSQIKIQREKPERCFVYIVLINLVILFIVITGIIMDIHDYISDTKSTYRSVTCCGSICLKCFFSFYTFATMLTWGCILLLFIGICKAIHKIISLLSLNYNFIYSLSPLPIECHPKLKNIANNPRFCNHLVLLNNSKQRYAFTQGLWKPKVYVSSGICSYLTKEELLAVILHEMHHQESKDPLKLFFIHIFSAFNFFLPVNQYLLNKFSSASEKAADDSAVNFSGESLDLASAIVKISRSNNITLRSQMIFFLEGQNTNIEERLRRLLEPEIAPPSYDKVYAFSSYFLSIGIAIAICLSLFKPLAWIRMADCNTMACHINTCR
ncbi:MAG TPA: M56 family metallopeptidase [Candidatus Brocadiaceae bacterium]